MHMLHATCVTQALSAIPRELFAATEYCLEIGCNA